MTDPLDEIFKYWGSIDKASGQYRTYVIEEIKAKINALYIRREEVLGLLPENKNEKWASNRPQISYILGYNQAIAEIRNKIGEK